MMAVLKLNFSKVGNSVGDSSRAARGWHVGDGMTPGLLQLSLELIVHVTILRTASMGQPMQHIKKWRRFERVIFPG